MLQYKNFTFNSKQDFINYIENRMIDYWKTHNDSFSRVCENLNSWDGFLDDDRLYPMDELDELLGNRKPSEVLQMVDTDNFDYDDDYFYYDGCGRRCLCSIDKKNYYDYVDYSEVFEKLIDDYGKIFNYRYGNAYYELFNDINNINSQDEDEIQDYIDLNLFLEDDYYDYLFVDDDDFFSNDDLNR